MPSEDDAPDAQSQYAPPTEVPFDALSPDALAGIIDAFVLREGTDYGTRETSHAAKVAQVRAQLERGEATIVFDSASQSVTLLTRDEYRRLLAAAR